MVDVAVGVWTSEPPPGWREGSRAITVEPEATLYVLLRFTSTHQMQMLFYPDLITESEAEGLMAEYQLVTAK
jgi:hypothetical protein